MRHEVNLEAAFRFVLILGLIHGYHHLWNNKQCFPGAHGFGIHSGLWGQPDSKLCPRSAVCADRLSRVASDEPGRDRLCFISPYFPRHHRHYRRSHLSFDNLQGQGHAYLGNYRFIRYWACNTRRSSLGRTQGRHFHSSAFHSRRD